MRCSVEGPTSIPRPTRCCHCQIASPRALRLRPPGAGFEKDCILRPPSSAFLCGKRPSSPWLGDRHSRLTLLHPLTPLSCLLSLLFSSPCSNQGLDAREIAWRQGCARSVAVMDDYLARPLMYSEADMHGAKVMQDPESSIKMDGDGQTQAEEDGGRETREGGADGAEEGGRETPHGLPTHRKSRASQDKLVELASGAGMPVLALRLTSATPLAAVAGALSP